jgi:hypothetical protein
VISYTSTVHFKAVLGEGAADYEQEMRLVIPSPKIAPEVVRDAKKVYSDSP